MIIRAAQPTDAAAIAKVHVDSWRTTYKGIVSDDFLAALSYEQRTSMWRPILLQSLPTSFVYVAEDPSGRIIGFASGGPERGGDPDYTGELYAIYLLEVYQRHGLGRHLTSTLVQRLVQAGMPSLLLWALAANPCRGFYEALGGQRLYDKQVIIGGTPLVEVAYGWRDARVLIVEPRGERRTREVIGITHPSVEGAGENTWGRCKEPCPAPMPWGQGRAREGSVLSAAPNQARDCVKTLFLVYIGSASY